MKGKLKDAIKVKDEADNKADEQKIPESMELKWEETAKIRWYEGNPTKCVSVTIGGKEFSI